MVLKLIFLSLIGSAISKILQDDLMLEALDEDFLFPNNEVPNYEIVPVFASAVEENGSRKVKINLRTFGKDLEMWVHPVEGVLATTRTPVYTVRNGVKLKRQRNAMKKVIEKLYHNKRFLASVTVNEAPSREVMHGIFGLYNYFIRPLYDSELYYTYLKNNAYPKWSNFSYHMIYKLPDIPKYIKALIPPKMKPKKWSQVPQTIYPEIMVIVDYPLFKLLKKNLKDTLGYILSFWNGVDLRYRSLQNPNYRLNIAGVIISEEPNALEYMRYHSEIAPFQLLIYKALDSSIAWLKKLEKRLPDVEFDVAITMSPEKFCRKSHESSKCEELIGVAFVGGACNSELKSAIVQDAGAFKGIDVTSHELGHLLGVEHDGTFHENCSSATGNLMAPVLIHTSHAGEWSTCSIKDFEKFLEKPSSDCLFNKPRPGHTVARFLPGKLLDANEQCKKRVGTSAAVIDATTCIALRCYKPDNPTIKLVQTGAADGTSCGPGMICLNKRCMKEELFDSLIENA
ncbi:venom metalloproteinase 3-like isoform X2 [Chelonus insularis]|uniref:venom metalloproteinase 3-like isoform X2 n=1 Tax=Chelonus insularis TaxID=460826 RepID=UPI00158962AA|nr:venom metalloproteinase 3-like isoform X2 [Chelonus insularis]